MVTVAVVTVCWSYGASLSKRVLAETAKWEAGNIEPVIRSNSNSNGNGNSNSNGNIVIGIVIVIVVVVVMVIVMVI